MNRSNWLERYDSTKRVFDDLAAKRIMVTDESWNLDEAAHDEVTSIVFSALEKLRADMIYGALPPPEPAPGQDTDTGKTRR